jgi:hypothetical protein
MLGILLFLSIIILSYIICNSLFNAIWNLRMIVIPTILGLWIALCEDKTAPIILLILFIGYVSIVVYRKIKK